MFCDKPQSAEARRVFSASDAQPDSGTRLRLRGTNSAPGTDTNTQQRTAHGLPSQSRPVWVTLFGLLAAQQFNQKETILTAETKLFSGAQNKQTLKLFK